MDILNGNGWLKQIIKLLKHIAITGPECTGKTWLAKKLASHYNTVWVPEYSVEYLQKKGSVYDQTDILNIAKGQLFSEEKLAEQANNFLFCDTDILVSKIWSKVVFGEVPEWIDKMFTEHKYDLYLLAFPDIEWQPGAFRESPENRDLLFDLYEKELVDQRAEYRIIKDDGEQRFLNAVNFVNELL